MLITFGLPKQEDYEMHNYKALHIKNQNDKKNQMEINKYIPQTNKKQQQKPTNQPQKVLPIQ